MAFVNYVSKNIAIKIIYYGPGLSGKTTNLRYIYGNVDSKARGELLCLETTTERTYFFDLLPLRAGLMQGFTIHFQLLTVPGQIFYEAARRSVLKGVDGIVFVADSQISLLEANLESFEGLKNNLQSYRVDSESVPLVFQYNKRDLDNLIPVKTFNSLLNVLERPYIESSAINGVGVFETLKEIAKLAVPAVRAQVFPDVGVEVPKRKEAEAKEKRDIEFVKNGRATPIQPKKVKVKSLEEMEERVESLTRKHTKNKKRLG